MKKLIFFFSVCCLLYSCDKYHYFDLPQDKIPLLRNNDIVNFQDSASSKIDTFWIDVLNWRQITNENGSFQHIEIYYNFLNSKSTFLHLSISSACVDCTSIGINNFNSWQTTTDYNTKTNFSVRGVIYPIVFVEHVYANLFPDTIPNTVYYTYRNGIIRYEYKDGRVYELVSK